MVDEPFHSLREEELDEAARSHGFARQGPRNWVRRTADFVQLVNLQRSQWSADDRYLNFALWPLAFGEPPTIAESKFHFRTRAGHMDASGLAGFFAAADGLQTLDDLKEAVASRTMPALVTRKLQQLLNG